MTKRVRAAVDLSAFESIIDFETEEVVSDGRHDPHSAGGDGGDGAKHKLEYTVVQVTNSLTRVFTCSHVF